MRYLFLGDIHGHFDDMLSTLGTFPFLPTYQLGDFGFGFPPLQRDIDIGVSSVQACPTSLHENLRIIRGNHDCPATAKKHPNYLGDYGIDPLGVGYLSGAMSLDQDRRTPGYDWWPEEELSLRELSDAVDVIVTGKPRIMISHQAPQTFEYFLEKWPKVSRTNEALEHILSRHAPELWVCGHHHVNEVKRVGNTLFVCVDQNQAMSLSVPYNRPITFSDIIFG